MPYFRMISIIPLKILFNDNQLTVELYIKKRHPRVRVPLCSVKLSDHLILEVEDSSTPGQVLMVGPHLVLPMQLMVQVRVELPVQEPQ